LFKRACTLRYHNRTKNVLNYAASLMGIKGDQWDSDPWLLGVQNGVIDLKTGQFRAGCPEDYIRKVAPTEWRAGAAAPRWEQFLREIFDGVEAMSTFLQRLLGYGITGLTEQHILPILWGKGRNGKDTLLETLAAVLGALASAGNNDLLIDQGTNHAGQASPHLYDLIGRRLVWVSETREGARLNVNQIKALTGGGRITARPLYGHPVEFLPSHLIILQTNHRPSVSTSSDDYALWQRLLLVPFTVSFVPNPAAPDERPQDPHLREKLGAEKSGILAWLVEGCLQWQKDGLNPPATVTAATREYQRDEDQLQQFIDERCCEGGSYRVEATAIFQAHEGWAKENGLPAISRQLFGRRLGKKFEKKHTATGTVYLGIGLLTTNDGS
jgi:putative DNA primase/helicase